MPGGVQVVIKDKLEQDEASQAEALRQAAATFKLGPLSGAQGAGGGLPGLTSQGSSRRPFAFKAAEHSSVRTWPGLCRVSWVVSS